MRVTVSRMEVISGRRELSTRSDQVRTRNEKGELDGGSQEGLSLERCALDMISQRRAM